MRVRGEQKKREGEAARGGAFAQRERPPGQTPSPRVTRRIDQRIRPHRDGLITQEHFCGDITLCHRRMPVMGYSGRLDRWLSRMRRGGPRRPAPLQRGSVMGSRGRSIRLRIYFLVAIPLIAMIGLLAYVAGTSVNNAINLDRAPDLINATSLPTADFGRFVLQAERAAAVIYLFRPTAANLAAYDAAITATDADRAGLPGRDELPGHQGEREPRPRPRASARDQRARPARPCGTRSRPASSARWRRSGLQRGHLDRAQAVPDETDSLTNATADPGPRA